MASVGKYLGVFKFISNANELLIEYKIFYCKLSVETTPEK
jgi:hypothetical protein